MTPKVSVIVPCYNTERYLENGMSFLLRQTLPEIEIICVNDASTDNTLQILEKMALFDTRVIVINLEKNLGPAAARNAGIKQATGEYIGFFDPDDMVDFNFYEKMYKIAKEDDVDMAIGDLKIHAFDIIGDKIQKRVDVFAGRMAEIAANLFRFRTHCTAIYRRKFINENKLEYPVEFRNGEDFVFVLRCIIAMQINYGRYAIVEDTFYHYMRHMGNLSLGFFNTQQVNDSLNSVKLEIDMLNNAPGLSETEHNLFLLPRIKSLTDLLPKSVTDKKTMELIAENLIQIYKSLKYKKMGGGITRNDIKLLSFLITENKEDLAKYLADTTKNIIRTYTLFNRYKIMMTIEKHNSKTYFLFGRYKLWQIQF